jgi:hypothetical protein
MILFQEQKSIVSSKRFRALFSATNSVYEVCPGITRRALAFDIFQNLTSPECFCCKIQPATQKCSAPKPLQAALNMTMITAFILLTTAFPVASSGSIHKSASAEAPTRSVPPSQTLPVCWHEDPVRRASAATQARDEPTAALRAAVWVATAVIAAASVAVAFAADQAQRYRRPARSGSARWEAGWAGQAGEGAAPAVS